MTDTHNAERLWALVDKTAVAMMTTEDDGALRSRPMAAVARDPDGLWFFTQASSHKVAELGHDQRLNLSYADPERQNYVSLTGTGRLVRDRAEIARRWTESTRIWFPRGIDDPDIALLQVSVEQGEYWDAPSATRLKVFGYAKAVLTGHAPRPGGHATVAGDALAAASTDM